MADQRGYEGLENAWVDVAWPGRHQDALRRHRALLSDNPILIPHQHVSLEAPYGIN
jgi:hypothetical protein